MALKIFGITYADKTTEYTPYRNDPMPNPHRWEWDAILDIIDNKTQDLNDDDLLGIFAHNFPQKTGLNKDALLNKLNACLTFHPEAEKNFIYNLSPQFTYPIAGKYNSFADWSEAGHVGITRLIQACCNICGLIYLHPGNGNASIYAQQFITTKKIYTNFINECIKPSLALLEGPLWDFARKDAGYTRALPAEQLKQKGITHYTYIPFVLERMMMQYAANLNLKIINLV